MSIFRRRSPRCVVTHPLSVDGERKFKTKRMSLYYQHAKYSTCLKIVYLWKNYKSIHPKCNATSQAIPLTVVISVPNPDASNIVLVVDEKNNHNVPKKNFSGQKCIIHIKIFDKATCAPTDHLHLRKIWGNYPINSFY
jgi:hypothetical protein